LGSHRRCSRDRPADGGSDQHQGEVDQQPEPGADGAGTSGPAPAPGRFDGAWRTLRGTVRIEAVALVGVLLITGFLVSQQPAAEEAGLRGLYETTAPLGDELQVQVVVDPNQVGRNAIHLYVLDATGRPAADIDELRLELTYLDEGIGPIELEPLFAGPGHWVANTDELRFTGDWEIRVVAGIDRFTEQSTEVTVPVAR
jgi:copper transport protein